MTGGVPRYLEEINPGEDADENIRRICFSPSGELFRDFDAIFNPQLHAFLPEICRAAKTSIEAGAYRFVSLSQLPEWSAVMGLPFENLVVNNALSLIPHLHLGNSIVESAAPYRNTRRQGKEGKTGCQIDLLIQTPMTAYVVEIKRKREIDASIIDEVRERMRRLPLRGGMSVRPVLVYDGELDPYVEGTGFFDSIISAQTLLGL